MASIHTIADRARSGLTPGGARDVTRWLPFVGGGVALMYGLKRSPLISAFVLGLGAKLLYDGLLRPGTRLGDRLRSGRAEKQHTADKELSYTGDVSDVVKEASEESFPASDAPSWTPTTSLGSTNKA